MIAIRLDSRAPEKRTPSSLLEPSAPRTQKQMLSDAASLLRPVHTFPLAERR
jgi:hypothetical protein